MEREVIEQKGKKSKDESAPIEEHFTSERGERREGVLERKGICVKNERAPEKLGKKKNNGKKEDQRIQNHLLLIHTYWFKFNAR